MLSGLVGLTFSNLLFFILHVTGSGSFPRPLSAKEEKEYLERFKEGDMAARNQLIEHNLRLVAHIINISYYKGIEKFWVKAGHTLIQQNGNSLLCCSHFVVKKIYTLALIDSQRLLLGESSLQLSILLLASPSRKILRRETGNGPVRVRFCC